MRKISKQTWGWALYDWANSAFAVSILAIVYQLYFKTRLATSGVDGDGNLVEAVTLPFGWTIGSEALWPLVVAVSMVLVVLITPVVGAVADYAGKKKSFLFFFCALGASATSLMVLLTVGMWKLGILLFVVANVSFVAGNVVYNGLLVDVTDSEEEVAFVSGFGWALGYLASFLVLALSLVLLWFEIPSADGAYRLSIFGAGLWWALFAIPTFLWVKERTQPQALPEGESLLSVGFSQLKKTARELRLLPQLVLFLAAFFLYNDGIQTIISQGTNFADEVLQMSKTEIVLVFLMIQVVAFLGSLLFIRVERRIGTKTALVSALTVWVALIGWAFVMHDSREFWVLGFMGGLVLGVSQSASRTIYAWMIPPEQAAEFFSLYAIVGKVASVIGPFLFFLGALFASRLANVPLVNSMALAVLPLFIMVLVGLGLLLKVDIEKGRAEVSARKLG
ncbi:MAG: MFS transporter [Gemmatimonadota bacterium]|jgi:UMF1 family MFS transporter